MGDRHLSLETMAKWLTGRLEHDDLLRDVVPHHLEQCSGCRQAYETLEILKQEVGHWDEEVALLETREAPDLAALLHQTAPELRADLIEEEESLHTWGLCHLLLKRSLAAARQDPGSAFDLADQAVRLTAHLGSTYDPQWVLGLRARALACRANARRVLGELRGAESDFRKARGCLDRSGMEGSRFEAEVLDLESSLRRDQRRFGSALDLAEQALGLYRKIQDSHGTAKVYLKKAKILEDSNDLEGAIELLRRPEEAIDPEREPHLYALARYNLVCCLSEAGQLEEAQDFLPEVRTRFQETAQPAARPGEVALGRRENRLRSWQERQERGGGDRVSRGAGGVPGSQHGLQRGAGGSRSCGAAVKAGEGNRAEAARGGVDGRVRGERDQPGVHGGLDPVPARVRRGADDRRAGSPTRRASAAAEGVGPSEQKQPASSPS